MLREVERVGTCRPGVPDDLFICFASFEERCLGAVRRFENYSSRLSCILRITDEPSDARESHCRELSDRLSRVSALATVDAEHRDPIVGIHATADHIREVCPEPERAAVTLDISTFPKKQLLLMLRALDFTGVFRSSRILYTEPGTYAVELNQALSFGLKEVTVVPTFAGRYDPQKELTLVIFLGYEGDRALALWENIEPHRTVVVIAKPAYRPEWEGKTEELNPAVLGAVDPDSVLYADSRDPRSTVELLESLIKPEDRAYPNNWYVAPLGTKLQAVGLYYFISQHPRAATIVYAAPLQHNEPYFSTGIGPTWIVPGRPPRAHAPPRA